MNDKIKLKIEWKPPEHPGLAEQGLANSLARILRPELFRLTDSVPEVLALADRLLKEPAERSDKSEALRRKAELESELARINAQLEEDLLADADSPGADCSSQNSPAV